MILLDAGVISRSALPDELQKHEIFCIDHHEKSPESIAGFQDATASSTCLILTELAQLYQWKITAEIATALLLGIYTDTG